MGANLCYLEYPKTEKYSHCDSNHVYDYCYSSMQGWRTEQEDAHILISNYDDDTSIFGVLDGHGGPNIAKYTASKLPDFIKKLETYKKGDIVAALEEGFVEFDKEMLEMDKLGQLKIEVDAFLRNGNEEKGFEIPNGRNNHEVASQCAQGSSSSSENVDSVSAGPENQTSSIDEEEAQAKSLPSQSSSSSETNEPCSSSTKNDESSSQNDPASSSVPTTEESILNSEEREAEAVDKDEPGTSSPNEPHSSTNEPSSSACSLNEGKGKHKKEIPMHQRADFRAICVREIYKSFLNRFENVDDDDEDEDEDEDFHPDGGNEGEDGSDEEVDDDDEDEDESCEEDEDEMMINEETDDDDREALHVGCTAVVSIVRGNKLYVANAGDSRCVLSRNGEAVALSEDHKPTDKPELQRIEKAGHRIEFERVDGSLNLSRAFGDFRYKDNSSLPMKEQAITSYPDVRTIDIDPEKDEFLVLACDGIWNMKTNQEVVDYVRERINKNMNLTKICEDLFDECLASNTDGDGRGCDNMTMIIVRFKHWDGKISKSVENGEKTSSIDSSEVCDTTQVTGTRKCIFNEDEVPAKKQKVSQD